MAAKLITKLAEANMDSFLQCAQLLLLLYVEFFPFLPFFFWSVHLFFPRLSEFVLVCSS